MNRIKRNIREAEEIRINLDDYEIFDGTDDIDYDDIDYDDYEDDDYHPRCRDMDHTFYHDALE